MKRNINQKNFVFHEIKEIKGKKKLKPEPCEIIEDLTEIHEIKDIKNNGQNQSNNIFRGRPRGEQDSHYRNDYCANPPQNNNMIYDEYPYEINNQNPDMYQYQNQNQYFANNNAINNEEQGQVNYGFVNAPEIGKEDIECNEIYEGKNEDDENDNSKLIETIFQQIKCGNIDNNNLKNIFRGLNENDKNEIIEGIKINIENKEQENILNNLLETLS